MAADLVTIATTAVLTQFFGPAGKYLGEQVLEKAKQVAGKAAALLTAVGREPQPVEPKVLLPLVQASALETDETLTDMWAALLANAADPAQVAAATPAFVDILRQLLPIDTKVLTWLFTHAKAEGEILPFLTVLDRDVMREFPENGELSIDNLLRLGLCRRRTEGNLPKMGYHLSGTKLGFEFMKACTPPTA